MRFHPRIPIRPSLWLAGCLLSLFAVTPLARGQDPGNRAGQSESITTLNPAQNHYYRLTGGDRFADGMYSLPEATLVAARSLSDGAAIDWVLNPTRNRFLPLSPGAELQNVELCVADQSTQLSDGTWVLLNDTGGPGGTWQFQPTRWGNYDLRIVYSLARGSRSADATLQSTEAEAGNDSKQPLTVKLDATGSPTKFHDRSLGMVRITSAHYRKPYRLDVSLSGDRGSEGTIRAVVLRPAPEGVGKICPQDDGVLDFPSQIATCLSTRLNYEPNPKKRTLGFWTKTTDRARWPFRCDRAGRYRVEVLQGCGKGQGGSQVALDVLSPAASTLAPQPMRLFPGEAKQDRDQSQGTEDLISSCQFNVQDTGHFQNFVSREIGTLELEAGEWILQVRPIQKAAQAVMDLRQVRLIPVPPEPKRRP